MQQHVVVSDPSGTYWPGAVIEEGKARQLAATGVVSLPVEPDLFRLSGVGGYHFRSWGSGWELPSPVTSMICPMCIYSRSDLTRLHWAIRLTADPELLSRIVENPDLGFDGFLRVVPDGNQATVYRAGLVSDDPMVTFRALRAPDKAGGWTVTGSGRITMGSEGIYPFALYGQGAGLRVQWAALSVSR